MILEDCLFNEDDLLDILEDFYWPSLITYWKKSSSDDFVEYLKCYDLSNLEGVQPRVELLLDSISKTLILGKEETRILGDIHPNGSTKSLSDGVIKYRDYPDYDVALRSIAELVLGSEVDKYFPKICVDKEKLFTRNYVNVDIATDQRDDIEAYYYNLGRIIPLLLILRAIDINAENILVNMPYPVLFDMETIFSGEFEDNFEEYSVRNTGIVKVGDIGDSSVLTGGLSERDSLLKPIVCGADSSPYIKWKVSSKVKYNNVPFWHGRKIDPKDFIQNIRKGYGSSVKEILESNEEICSRMARVEGFVRVIMRPTRIYRFLLMKSCYPEVYEEEELRDFFAKELRKYGYIYKVRDNCMLDTEIKALSNLMIPVYYSNLETGDIVSAGGEKVASFEMNHREYMQRYFEDKINSEFFSEQWNTIDKSFD